MSLISDVNPERFSLLSTIAEKSLDIKFKLRGSEPTKSKIIIVAGDEKSFQKWGQWPFDRASVFAPMIEKMCSYNPKAIGFDIVWSEHEKLISEKVKNALAQNFATKSQKIEEIIKSQTGDTALRSAFENCNDKIVLGYALDQDPNGGLAKDEYQRRLKQIFEGKNNIITSLSKGRVKFAKFRSDAESTVDFYYQANTGLLNVPEIIPPKTAFGFFNNEPDSDGNYRKAMFFYRAGDNFVPSLTLRMAQKALSQNDSAPKIFIQANAPEHGLVQDLKLDMMTVNGPRRVPIDFYGQSIINYRGRNQTFANISMADIISPSETITYEHTEPNGTRKPIQVHKSELFKNALVLVGITANALYDIRPNPLDPMASGVENHANILDNILNNDFLIRPTTDFLIKLLIGIGIISLLYGLAIAKLDARLGALFSFSTIFAMLYFDQVHLFNKKGIVFSGHLQALQFLFQYIGITVLKYMREESEKKFIRSAFDKYVSPAVIESMLSDPSRLRLGGEKRELSILFSDIRGFTELSEKVDVKTLTQFLNEYLGAMTEILQSNQGTLDKYIGDAVMGFWGAPLELKNHATLAVKTAVEMVAKLDELNLEFEKKYGLKIDIGIGINSGAVSVGNFGSSKVFEYTVIGDNVNLASRLEGINKYYGTHIIISETTFAQLQPSQFLTREVDTVKVKGKQKPVKIYEVFPDNSAHAPLKQALTPFNEALNYYYSKDWNKALASLENVIAIRKNDRPSLELIERCNHYKQNPPEQDWDGSWEMHSK